MQENLADTLPHFLNSEVARYITDVALEVGGAWMYFPLFFALFSLPHRYQPTNRCKIPESLIYTFGLFTKRFRTLTWYGCWRRIQIREQRLDLLQVRNINRANSPDHPGPCIGLIPFYSFSDP